MSGRGAETGAADGKRGSRGGPFSSIVIRTAKSLAMKRGISLSGYLAAAQNAASSSSMISLSMDSSTARVLVSSGRKFFAKNEATAILPS